MDDGASDVTGERSDALLRAWGETLAQRRGAAAVFDTRGEVLRTFVAIEDEAQNAARTTLRDVSEGSVVGIQIGNHAAWPALLLACLRRRLIVLPLERTMAAAEREAACAICHVEALLSEEAGEVVTNRTSAPAVDWGKNQPPVLLKLTSGTTAAPRAIRFRSEQLLADCAQICQTMEITDADLNFGVIPFSHSYGFSNLITPLIARGVPLVVSRDRMPRAVLDDLARTKATVFPGMPVFYQAFCEMDAVPEFPELRLCISAGAPLVLSVARKFREKFGRPIHSFYGSSECGGICYDRNAALVEEGFVGPELRGVQVRLLLSEASGGRVRVRSVAAGDGYFPDADNSKLGEGSFVPDDLLQPTNEGFRIVGRISDLINVAGKKVNPTEVEAVLLRCEGVREAVVFGRPSKLRNEEVAACVVTDAPVTELMLLDFCRGLISGWQVPKRILFVDKIPVTKRGKINRRTLAELFPG